MTIARFLQIAAKNWRRSLAAALLAGIAVAAYGLLQPVTYTATSVVYVTAAAPTSGSDLNQSSAFISKEMKSYAMMARSEAVMTGVLRHSPGLDMSATDLASTIQVTVPPESAMVQIVASSPDPDTARQTANLTASGLTVEIKARQNASGLALVAGNQVGIAETPTRPTTPNLPLTAAWAGAAALATYTAAVLGLFLLDRRVTTPADLSATLGTHTLAHFTATDRPGPFDMLTAPAADLAHSLTFLEVVAPVRTIGVADPASGHGAPMVAANLAFELARRRNGKVALVDLNFADPTIHDRLSVPATPGVTDVLGRGPIGFACRTVHDQLDVYTAGTVPPNPAELAACPALATEMESLRAEYSAVVVVTGPLDDPSGADIAALTDGVIVVARLGKTTGPHIAAARATLDQAHVRTLGGVTTHRTNERRLRKPSGPRRKVAA